MQSIFRLAWCTDQAGDKKSDKAMLPKMRQTPVVEIPIFSKLKRKRSESIEAGSPNGDEISRRRKLGDVERSRKLLPGMRQSEVPVHTESHGGEQGRSESVTLPSFIPDSTSSSTSIHHSFPVDNVPETGGKTSSAKSHNKRESTDPSNNASVESQNHSGMRQIIEHQFNLEILLKHRELRLIEQELAKCQTALEQLRRCEIIPYPGSMGLSEKLSAGRGPALKAPPGCTTPDAPAPWGVVDGPYSRHYARWLLNDPTFDAIPANQTVNVNDNAFIGAEGRSTRNSNVGLGRAGKGRTARDSVGNLREALPNYPVQTRGKGGPLVIKRMADNQFVKLICNNCNRGDFSSVQGFLNHCRIAHKVDYKSHELAAADCGRLLDDHESHLVPQAAPSMTPVAKPTATPKLPVPAVHANNAFVHPLNAPVMPRNTWKIHNIARVNATAGTAQPANVNIGASPAATSFHAHPLIPTALAPYLSAQFAKRGLGGDLQRATSMAREKVDFGPESAEDDETASLSRKNSVVTGALPDLSMQRSQSRKGARQPTARPRPAPLAPSFASALRSAEVPESPQDMNLSPHTADSNPGLVSDHEDDDVASEFDEARSDRHHSPAPADVRPLGMRGATCGSDAMDVDIEIEDDGNGVLIRPKNLSYQELRGAGSPSRPVSRYGEKAK